MPLRFGYTISDGNGGTATATVSITINGQNDAPLLVTPLPDVEVNEDDPDTLLDLSNVFADVDASDTLTHSVSGNTNTSLVTTAIVGSDLVLDYQADQSGIAVITVRSTDAGGLSAEDTLTVTVLSAADQLNNIVADVGELGLIGGHATALTFAEEWLRFGNHEASASYVKRIQELTAQTVLAAAKKYLHPGRMQMVLMGPVKKVLSSNYPEGDFRVQQFGQMMAGK